MVKSFFYSLIIISVFVFLGCNQGENSNKSIPNTKNHEEETVTYSLLEIGQQTIKVNEIPVDIIVPDGEAKGDLMILPGWNLTPDQWCKNSDLCTKALAKGYRLILPEMGLSVYASNYFPQTRMDWINAPTGTWLTDTLIKHLQNKYGILLPTKKNFIIGLSTGGRGVVMTALKTAKLFKAGASLSGDFDQALTPYDNIMAGFYGDYETHKDLWATVDNPAHDAASLQVPMYLGHGLNDAVVPSNQTKIFYETLKKTNPKLKVILHISETGLHDFKYWNSEVDAALNFFEQ